MRSSTSGRPFGVRWRQCARLSGDERRGRSSWDLALPIADGSHSLDALGRRPTADRLDGVWLPEVDPRRARLEIIRRYLRIFGPAIPGIRGQVVARWDGERTARALKTTDQCTSINPGSLMITRSESWRQCRG